MIEIKNSFLFEIETIGGKYYFPPNKVKLEFNVENERYTYNHGKMALDTKVRNIYLEISCCAGSDCADAFSKLKKEKADDILCMTIKGVDQYDEITDMTIESLYDPIVGESNYDTIKIVWESGEVTY